MILNWIITVLISNSIETSKSFRVLLFEYQIFYLCQIDFVFFITEVYFQIFNFILFEFLFQNFFQFLFFLFIILNHLLFFFKLINFLAFIFIIL